MTTSAETFWDLLRDHAGPYPPQAFVFVQEGLRHTVSTIFGDDGESDDEGLGSLEGERHVSGQQLCLGLRDFAQREFGLLARTVLESWGVRRTEDFGNIVFAMVNAGLMRKTDEDQLIDFEDVFDFEEVFGRELESAISSSA